MRRLNRGLVFLLLISIASAQSAAQLKTPLTDPIEPFRIQPGSTFTASGGVPGTRPEAMPESPSPMAAEIFEAEQLIRGNHIDNPKLSTDELTKSALEGMLRSLDPHSNYYDRAEWKELLDEQRSGYTGIGATIATFQRNEEFFTYILSTFPGSPAERASLRFGDRVIAINGESMAGKTTDVVRDKVRGAMGTAFRLTVERAANLREETIEIKRNRVPQPSIPDAYILRPGIGYIELSEGFNYTTADEFDVAMRELKRRGMRSLVLDLRNNGGGIVDQAVKIAERFLPAGQLILSQRGRTRIDNRVWKSKNPNPEQLPLVILVNENTASASEIVAGAFQDDDRAMIVGEKTFGKGLVQSVLDLPGKTGLTLTTARYLTPSGRSIQRDYSKLNLYDYFNHKTASTEIGKPYFEARTITDRKVFGGDGVHPDEAVATVQLNRSQLALLDPIFQFSREVANGRIDGLGDYRLRPGPFGQRITASDFPFSERLFAAFVEYSRTNGSRISPSSLAAESDFIKLRLRYNIVMASFGAVSANQVITEDDAQVAKAIESLPRSAKLANLARQIRKTKK
ncbi:MAG: S41 family peptidase [Pyrinomonadaceae bacterium]